MAAALMQSGASITVYLAYGQQNLTSLNNRLAEFVVDRFPNDGAQVELLCVDHNGTYVIPFACHRIDNAWRNVATQEVIEAEVAGWRFRI